MKPRSGAMTSLCPWFSNKSSDSDPSSHSSTGTMRISSVLTNDISSKIDNVFAVTFGVEIR